MKLLTKLIKANLEIATSYNEGNVKGKNVVVKFFAPWTSATWYIFEGTEHEQPNGMLMFGMCDLGHKDAAELGYVSLPDLMSVTGPGGLKIERDLHYKGNYSDLQKIYPQLREL